MLLAASAPPLFAELAILIVVGTLIALVSARLGAAPIVGFLVAGAVIGPGGIGLIGDINLVNQSADIGVVLLLFTLGIEFSLQRVRQLASLVLVGGFVQVGLTTGIVAAIVAAFGVEWRPAVFTGLLVSLSSTAIVLKMLAQRRATTSPTGNMAVSLLIFQDLAIVGMVLLVPFLSGDTAGPADALVAVGKALGIVVAVLIAARTVVPKLLRSIAEHQSSEVFLLAVLGICFGTAYLSSLLEVSISLGAFLAGLMVSESRVASRALGEVMPLQILFSATFFVSIGMLLDLQYLLSNALLIIGLAFGVVVVKVLTAGIAAAVLRQPGTVVVSSALIVAQIGEFSFVLEREGQAVGLVPAGVSGGIEAFIAVTVLLMALSTYAVPLADRVLALFMKAARPDAAPPPGEGILADPLGEHMASARDHVVVTGYGPRAGTILDALDRASVPYNIVVLDPGAEQRASEAGRSVLVGDVSRELIAERVGLRYARLVLAVDSPPAVVEEFARIARAHNPDVVLLAWTEESTAATELQRDGLVDHVVAEREAAVDALINHALGHFEVPEATIETVMHDVMDSDRGDEPVSG